MIQRENAPTLCTRCVHFTKGIDVGCKIGNFGIEGDIAERIREWCRRQSDESSWTYMGPCPSFKYDGGDAALMRKSDRKALYLLIDDSEDDS